MPGDTAKGRQTAGRSRRNPLQFPSGTPLRELIARGSQLSNPSEIEVASGAARLRLRDALDDATSARHDLATALSHERTLLRTMIDLIPAYIYAKDTGSRFIACNEYLGKGTTFYVRLPLAAEPSDVAIA